MPCGNSTLGIDTSIRECKCNNTNSILQERNEDGSFLDAKECVVCAGNTVANNLTNMCETCPDPVMVVGGDSNVCTCPSDYQLVTSLLMDVEKCVYKTHINLISSKIVLSTAKEMTYSSFLEAETGNSNSVVSIASDVLDDMFLAATTGCYFYQTERDIASCQALGNLCVMQHFDPATPSCIMFDLIQRSGRSATVNNINGWFTTLPFLNYRSVASSVIQTPVVMKMSSDAASNEGSIDHLQFILASYHVNGTLIGLRSLTNELAYCQTEGNINTAGSSSWMRFGVSALSEYSCNLDALSSSLALHELFLVDQSKSNDEAGRYLPVPVKNLNYRDTSGVLVNQDDDVANDFLSHRFFIYDVQTGIPVGEASPKILRYAKSITLAVKTQPSDPHSIYVPELTIKYVDTQRSTFVAVSFRATYTSDTDKFWSFAKTLFTVGCALAGCRVLLLTFNWYRRNIRNEVVENAMWQVLLTLLRYGGLNFVPVCFGVMLVMCSYFFMVFRLQSSTVLMLPEVNYDALAEGIDEYYPFRVLLPLSFFCQLVSVVRHVYRQAKLELFFIDWEKPRATIMDIDSAKPTHAPVSVWRMILVVNEWNKLQTVRKTSLRFTLVFVLFLLYGCNFRMLSLPVPRAQMQYVTLTTTASSPDVADHQLNPYLRFANISLWWLLTYVSQRVWKWMIFERYIDEPREQLFIDLCTVSKVSCLFLDESYHGFYLHCRSPHPFADGNMSELVDQLKQEEAGLTAGRHLDSTFPNCQTFEIFVTRKWKRKFRNLYSSVRGDIPVDGRGGEGLIQRSFSPKRPATLPVKSTDLKRQNGAVVTEAMVRHAEQLRDFLQSFIENQNERFRWRIYRAHTCLTRFLDIPPDMSYSKQSLFLPDTASRFAKASLLLGIENDLMLLDLLCFCLFDLWIGNHAISAIATYALQMVLLSTRAHVGRRNIAKSTLVDSRFLI
ncbi:Transmembrane protein [Phytophthora megakarya]|uniref:Transmembrane protein n=1 Tax=Phytophthora megakarya TaxID=4795 RepID=A0A225WUK3_9STRA|nr:Transmembrane protein [Phytophthora megakarya]